MTGRWPPTVELCTIRRRTGPLRNIWLPVAATCSAVIQLSLGWRQTRPVSDAGSAGRRAAPPEDCGGVWGYAELIEILADPGHPDYEDRLDRLGLGPDSADEFDPAEFGVAEVNEMLALPAEAPTR